MKQHQINLIIQNMTRKLKIKIKHAKTIQFNKIENVNNSWSKHLEIYHNKK